MSSDTLAFLYSSPTLGPGSSLRLEPSLLLLLPFPPYLPNSSFSLFTYQLKHHIVRETFSALPGDFSPSSWYISEPISLSNITVCERTFVFVLM